MDLEVVGRHALFFDDDASSAFVNSQEALVEWNSLLIDRYDVRHLLQTPPPLLKRRRQASSSPTSFESEIDQERYLDLPPPPSDDNPDESSSFPESNNGEEQATAGTYNAVAFSYGNSDVSTDQKNSDMGLGNSSFIPPFPVPDSLLQNLPPTEKLHQIMARTAVFVSKHGGQSEIVLRVKQGDNPTFGFLMPDHHLHAYFRFLVDHPQILKYDRDGKLPDEDTKTDNEQKGTADISGGALSLLGSVYGSGEDEDGSLQVLDESKEKMFGDSANATKATHSPSDQTEAPVYSAEKDEEPPKQPLSAVKEKTLSIKRNRSIMRATTSNMCSKKIEGDSSGSIPTSMQKSQASSGVSMVKHLIVEPPSEVKRTMEKLVEFILKNGKEFEAVLIEQDATNGRFPFLKPSNQYHPYYLKVLQKAQESKQTEKSIGTQKLDTIAHVGSRKAGLPKENDAQSELSGGHDVPYDSEKKEKFKMKISGPKKDAHDPLPKPTQQQCGVSVDTAAAIIQAARRGLRNPNFDLLPKKSLDEPSLGLSGEAGPNSSFGSFSLSSLARSSTPKLVTSVGEPNMAAPVDLSRFIVQPEKEGGRTSSVSVAKAIAKTAALAAATEADSSEACLTKEQKQKAERLKRAKMFAAMIKGGAAPRVDAPSPSLSAEPPDYLQFGLQGSGHKASSLNGPARSSDTTNLLVDEVDDTVGREREGSSVPVDIDTSDRMDKSKKKDSDDDYKEKRTRMKHHLRSRRHDAEDDDDDERDHRHSRKKHRSHHSSHHDRDERSHRKRHSSSKDGESRHRHRHHSSSEDEHHHRSRSDRHRKRSQKERKVEAEDGEISTSHSDRSNAVGIGDGASRDASLDLLEDRNDRSSALVTNAQPSGTAEVSDDLRAKVRAMLLATM